MDPTKLFARPDKPVSGLSEISKPPSDEHTGIPPDEIVNGLLSNGSTDLALLDKMPIGLAIHDAEGVMVHANAYFARLVDCPHLPSRTDTVLRWQGQTPEGVEMPPHDFPCARALRGEIVSPGVDLLHFGKDGQGRWLNVSAAPITDHGCDEILGIVVLYIDAHDAVQAGAFGVRAARRFRQFAENSGAAIWIADSATEAFTYRNPPHLGLSGAGDIVDIAGWLDRVDERDRRPLRQHYDAVRQGRTAPFEYGFRGIPGRHARRLREMSFPIRDDVGTIVMIGGMTENVTPPDPSNLYLVGTAMGRSVPAWQMAPGCPCRTKSFGCLAELLDVAQFLTPGCVIVDLASADDAEINLARTLAEYGGALPIIIIGMPETHAATAVAAMRAGAADYLIPPFAEDALGEAITRAAARCPAPAAAPAPPGSTRIDRLSKREREVMLGLKAGGTNKSIARDLGISPRTVELHRSHLMERLNVRNLAEMLQLS